MKAPVIEVPAGSVNGVNATYTTQAQYRAGTLKVWLNGMLQLRRLEDGFHELPPNRFRLKEPPCEGDTVQCYYLPA